MKKSIEVVPYDPNWPGIFASESALIRQALGDNCLAIHHIGSTAVPGLAAKPKIDMIVVVKELLLGVKPIQQLGYVFKGEYNIPMRGYFNNKSAIDPFHIHMYEEFHPEIELNLCFRDYLRKHPNKRDDYAKLKADLIQDESSFDKEQSPFTNYTLRKGYFIREVLREAGFNRVRMMQCNDDTEWLAAKHFRDTYFFGPCGIEDKYTWTFNHAEHAHLVLYQGVEIIGYAHIQFSATPKGFAVASWPDKRAAIRIIAVDENKRNQNSGSVFLALIEKWLKSLWVKSIHAESRQSSLQ
jgi:GrpB-like predicted nucleotidyltransferase (UPF0157 family)